MKKWWLATPLVVALLLFTAVPSHAWRGHFHGGSRVFVGVGVGPGWWGYPYPYWYYPPPYVYSSPTVVVQQPPVFIEQQATIEQAPPAASPPQFWYFCQPTGAYYPHVQTCVEPWIKVPARSQ